MAQEAFFTQGGSYDASELRKFIGGQFVDEGSSSLSYGGVLTGLTVEFSGTPGQLYVTPGTAIVPDGVGGAYMGHRATNTASMSYAAPCTVYARINDPGSGATAGEMTLAVAAGSSPTLPALSVPVGTVDTNGSIHPAQLAVPAGTSNKYAQLDGSFNVSPIGGGYTTGGGYIEMQQQVYQSLTDVNSMRDRFFRPYDISRVTWEAGPANLGSYNNLEASVTFDSTGRNWLTISGYLGQSFDNPPGAAGGRWYIHGLPPAWYSYVAFPVTYYNYQAGTMMTLTAAGYSQNDALSEFFLFSNGGGILSNYASNASSRLYINVTYRIS